MEGEGRRRHGRQLAERAPAARATKASSAFVQRLPNSIGYVEYAYAKQNKMAYALLKNKDGNFVAPDADDFKAAAAGADWTKSFYQVLTDQAGQGRLADHRRDIHPDVQVAGEAGERGEVAEVLRLGLRQRRQDGRRPRVCPAA